MKVVDVMTPNPHCVTADQPLLAAASLMREHDIGFVPVIDSRQGRRPVGVLTDRDIAVRHVAAAHHHDCPCGDAMTHGELATVASTDDVASALEQMRRFAVRRLLVTEPSGRLVGVVAEADLLRRVEAVGVQPLLDVLESRAEPAGLER